jgi:hypothetical protein
VLESRDSRELSADRCEPKVDSFAFTLGNSHRKQGKTFGE